MFEKVYLINLKKREDKKEHMMKRISKIDCIKDKLEIIEAVDGCSLKSYFEENKNITIGDWINPFSQNTITTGEIGCALSHLNIWTSMVKNGITEALIIEDDIIFEHDFLERLTDYYTQIEDNSIEYDLFYLSRKSFEKDLTKLSNNIHNPCLSYWTCSYILTNKGAQKLYNSGYNKYIIPVDEFLPICYLKQNSLIEKYTITDFNAIVGEPLLISPEPNAFQTSDTEISQPFIKNRVWKKYKNYNIQIVTVATDPVDGYKQFIRSCEKYDIPCITLGMNQEWEGLDMSRGPGGGHKVTLFREYLQTIENHIDDKYIIIFTDSYDVILNSNIDNILEKYLQQECDILFTAELYCWPNSDLAYKYPTTNSPFKYLNSGGIIGSLNGFKNITQFPIKNYDDDQLYYTNLFLNKLDIDLNIKLDYNCEIFQALNGASNYIDIDFDRSATTNSYTQTSPCILHGNGGVRSKMFLNQLGNYIPLVWRPTYLYQDTEMKKGMFKELLYEDYPTITIFYICISLDKDSFSNILNLKYPKNKIKLVIIIPDELYYEFKNKIFTEHVLYYDNIKFSRYTKSDENLEILNILLTEFTNTLTEYIFMNTSGYIINNIKTLQLLIEKNKDLISPMLVKNDSNFSNFWGDLDDNGYYKRSFNYFDIIDRKHQGCWNMPYISGAMLINKAKYTSVVNCISNSLNNTGDYDMLLCEALREKNIFMYVSNLEEYGYIV